MFHLDFFFLLKQISCIFLCIETTCFTQFENVGCYADKQLSPRPIPDLIFSDLDKESPKYSGNEARLGELDAYLSDVLCRCAEQTQELGYIFFGVQNHGESQLTQVFIFESRTNMTNVVIKVLGNVIKSTIPDKLREKKRSKRRLNMKLYAVWYT